MMLNDHCLIETRAKIAYRTQNFMTDDYVMFSLDK
jgi:hypothetical protein